MKKNGLKSWFSQWEEGNFDFALMDTDKKEKKEKKQSHDWETKPLEEVSRAEMGAYRKLYPVLALALAIVMSFFLMRTVAELPAFGDPNAPAHNEVMERYVEKGTEETGAVNTVAGVILDYRAFDTLGESHVLFTAVIAVFMLLLNDDGEEGEFRSLESSIMRGDSILGATAKVMIPVIILFGVYVILNGHLGPGGGFSGGAVIGGGLILYSIAFGFEGIEKYLNMKTFRTVVLCALYFYSIAKCYSFFCGSNHLESIVTTGTPGMIFSAGLIMPLNAAVGIVVACTMYGIYSVFKRGRI